MSHIERLIPDHASYPNNKVSSSPRHTVHLAAQVPRTSHPVDSSSVSCEQTIQEQRSRDWSDV